jgi:hypothetical protein
MQTKLSTPTKPDVFVVVDIIPSYTNTSWNVRESAQHVKTRWAKEFEQKRTGSKV